MNIGCIIKPSIKLISKSKNYWSQLLVLIVLALFSGYINLHYVETDVDFNFIITILSISFFGFMITSVISELTIKEKKTKRMEVLLANGASIHNLFKGYSISTFLLCIIPNYILIFTICITSSQFVNEYSIVYFVFIYPTYCLMFSALLNIIVLIIKNLSKLKNILFLIHFLIIYLGRYIYTGLNMLNYSDSVIIYGLPIIFFLVYFFIFKLLYNRLDNEIIILSI